VSRCKKIGKGGGDMADLNTENIWPSSDKDKKGDLVKMDSLTTHTYHRTLLNAMHEQYVAKNTDYGSEE
jgi:hypothetical protein